MPYKKKQKVSHKKIILLIAIIATTLILLAAGVFAFFLYQKDQEAKAAAALDALPRIVVPEGHFTLTSYTEIALQKGQKAVTIRPGVDVYQDINADQAALEAEVDKIIADLKTMGFNSVILDTKLENSVVFASNTLSATPIDLLSIFAKKAAENEIALSVIYNLTGVNNGEGALMNSFLPFANRQAVEDGLSELVVGYEIETLLLNNYYAQKNGASFAEYQSYGSAGDYQVWLKENVNAVIDEMLQQAKRLKGTLPIGLCVSSVWANETTAEGGSATKATFQALTNGFADTKALVEMGMVDFIDVQIPTSTVNGDVSFKTAVNWWGNICQASNIPMFVTHSGESANNKELPGWNGTDELTRQVVAASALESYYGSTFTGLSNMVADLAAHPQEGSSIFLKKYYDGQIKPDDVNQGLQIISPTANTKETYEEIIQVKLKFDPNAEVLLNGQKVEPSSRGGASVWVPLNVGPNTIKIEHKGRVTNFNIERKIIIFKEVSPTGTMKVAGSSTLEVTALAYKGSKVTATLNGQTITLTEGGGGEENDAESAYRVFSGSITMPKATAKDQPIGQITVKGVYQNLYSKTEKGAVVTVEKLADEVDPDEATGKIFTHATVNMRYANTYPFNTAGGYPQAIDYQLPYGTQDIVVSQSGDYLNLRSGKTIMRQSAILEDIAFEGNNPISQMTVGVEGNDTVIRATMAWKSPFSIDLSPYAGYSTKMGKQDYYFNGDTVTVLLDYGTTLKPENFSGDMSDSPIFSGISHKRIKNEARGTWQYQITLPLRQAGKYYGAHATWEENTLVIRFNHPAQSGSLSGVKIAVDPGHGGKHTGNLAGRDSVEKELNMQYAFKLADVLRAKGAEVYMIREDDSTIENEVRVDRAEANGCDLYIAVHQNSSPTTAAAYGVQTYYNAPFSQPLAQAVQASLETVAPASKWNYWNGSQTTYNFVVTRERQFPSILVECGFLSNVDDEARALNPAYQQQMVEAMAQGIVNYYS